MTKTWKGLACLLACSLLPLGLLATPAAADHHEKPEAGQAPQMSAEEQAMMAAWMKAGTPGEQHRELAAGAGAWKATVRTWMGAGEPTVSEANVTREMTLDGRVLTERWQGAMMGMPFVGHGMLGYDNARGKYWSTWNDNMSTGVMVSWGAWDDEAKGVVFHGEMSDPMAGGAPIKIKSIARQKPDGSETFEMWEPRGPGGELVRTMEITMVRQ